MSPDAYEILPGALLISDAHYSKRRPQLFSLLQALDSGRLDAPQLILMGDIFDLLFGEIGVTHKMNAQAVAVLRNISRNIPVLYLEGNHDYNLKKLFPDARIVPLSKQPLSCHCGGTRLLLAHGDFNGPLGYRIYTMLIRNPLVLHFLGFVNRVGGNAVIDRLEHYLDRKNDCYVIPGFEAMTQRHLKRLDLSKTDVFIEGHYHQGKAFEIGGVSYFNLSAFACNQHYAIVRHEQKSLTLQERAWAGGV
jgi:UDP-2,3-diacylglucosamine hydrolase